MYIELAIPSNHLTLCCPLLFLLSIFPSIRAFSNESVLHIRWPKYWRSSFSISPSNEYSGLITFRIWRRKWQPTPVLLPGKFHGWRTLVGYSPWSHKELDMTEQLHFISFCSFFWRRKWQPTPVFLPGESHGQRGLVGCKESDMTKQLTHRHTPLGLASLISLLSKGLSRDNSSTTKASILQCSTFFMVQLSHPYMTTGKIIALTRWTFVNKVMSVLLNALCLS